MSKRLDDSEEAIRGSARVTNVIILVDDEDIVLEKFKDLFMILDIDVDIVSCSSSQEAFDNFIKIKGNPSFDVKAMLVDQDLAGEHMRGIEIINHVNTVLGNNVIIGCMIDGKVNADLIQEVKKVGGMFLLNKTGDKESMKHRLSKLYNDFTKNYNIEFAIYE